MSNSMKHNNRQLKVLKNLIFIFGSVITFLCVVIVTSGISLLFLKYIYPSTTKSNERKIFEYHYYSIDTISKIRTSGMMSSYNYIRPNEHKSYKSGQSVGSTEVLLLTPNETNPYVTTGSCIFKKIDENGNDEIIENIELISLHPSYSQSQSSLYSQEEEEEIITNNLKQLCEEEWNQHKKKLNDDDNNNQLLIHEIQNIKIDYFWTTNDEGMMDVEEYLDEPLPRRAFRCRGYCVPRLYKFEGGVNAQMRILLQRAKNFGCEKLIQSGEVTVPYPTEFVYAFGEKVTIDEAWENRAEEEFRFEYMYKFCEWQSEIPLREGYIILPNGTAVDGMRVDYKNYKYEEKDTLYKEEFEEYYHGEKYYEEFEEYYHGDKYDEDPDFSDTYTPEIIAQRERFDRFIYNSSTKEEDERWSEIDKWREESHNDPKSPNFQKEAWIWEGKATDGYLCYDGTVFNDNILCTRSDFNAIPPPPPTPQSEEEIQKEKEEEAEQARKTKEEIDKFYKEWKKDWFF